MNREEVCTCWPGATVWLTGLPDTGTTTIARELAGRLREEGRRVEVLDADAAGGHLSAGSAPSPEDRSASGRRVGTLAEVLARNGIVALVPATAACAAGREAVRARHRASGTPYVEVHVAAPVAERPDDEPKDPDLRIDSPALTARESAAALHTLLAERGLA
ncbi:adenylyl-sulfate kinase [Streptomyces sp. NPDC058052]|uniref:adenylyl-sulfate kinase n=1 Tax=Streptomyces sp. NPDC058052 TaxID=3346316 RepID=UPI0036DFEE47